MARKTKKTTVVAPEPPKYPKVLEVYGEPSMPSFGWQTEMPTNAMNSIIRIERYRVTIEKIEEPIEVLRERLLTLWRTDERNAHHWDAFEYWAKQLGMDWHKDFLNGPYRQGQDNGKARR